MGLEKPNHFDSDVRSWAKTHRIVRPDGKLAVDAHTLAAQIGTLKAMKKYKLSKVLALLNRIERRRNSPGIGAKEFVDAAHEGAIQNTVARMNKRERLAGELYTDHINGTMPVRERIRRLEYISEQPASTPSLVTTVNALSEGVDVPALDGLTFIDPRTQETDIVQAVGRVLRKKKDGNKRGTIVIPVYLEGSLGSAKAIDAALSSSAFQPVWHVLRALREHDTTLGDEIDKLRTHVYQGGSAADARAKHFSDHLIFEFAEHLPQRISFKRFAEAFQTKAVNMAAMGPFLTRDLVRELMVAYEGKHGKYPPSSGRGAKMSVDALEGFTWGQVYSAIYRGAIKGIPKGTGPKQFRQLVGLR